VAHGATWGSAQPEYLTWAERARGFADPHSVQRIHADLALANAWRAHGQLQQARALRLQTLALARQLGDPEALFRSAFFVIGTSAPGDWGERLRQVVEATSWPRDGVSSQTLGLFLWAAGSVLLAWGDRAGAEKLWREIEELAARTHVVAVDLLVPQRDAVIAILDGHLEDAQRHLRRLVELADETGASARGRQLALQTLLAPTLYLGQAQNWLATFDEYVGQARLGWPQISAFAASRAICLAQLGSLEEARSLVGTLLDKVETGSSEGEMATNGLLYLLEAAVLLEHQGAARALSEQLACVADLTFGDSFQTCVARHLGDAAALLGDRAIARAYFSQALETAGKIRFRPELALTHLRLAELLHDEQNPAARSEAHEHLSIAIPELREMKMRRALDRALALREHPSPRHRHTLARRAESDPLTAREWETASLIAGGSSNREIAERLVIAEGTVEVHVKHILSKLGLRSRTQVARWFARHYNGHEEDLI
jgi:ATP/maltotriose-dependent transcriptional regulator MalT